MTTYYEIALRRDDGKAWALQYSARLTAQCLRNVVGFRREKLALLLADLEPVLVTEAGKGGDRWFYMRGRGWWIGYTGRTQREAEQDGALPWIGEVIA